MNIQSYIWKNIQEFYLSKNQEEIYDKVKNFNVSGPIHVGGNEGSGKTFLVRRLLDENSLYLPIHYDFDILIEKKYSSIIIDNIKNFHRDIILKIKKSIQYCSLLIIVSEIDSKDLDREIRTYIRRFYDLEPPDYKELQEFGEYFINFFKLNPQKLPNSIKNFADLIKWIEILILNIKMRK